MHNMLTFNIKGYYLKRILNPDYKNDLIITNKNVAVSK